jgi:hypothetical protein
VREEPDPLGVDVHVSKRGPGEKNVVDRSLDSILQQTMREDDILAGRLDTTADRLPQERSVVADDLQAKSSDVPARVARAALIGLHLPLQGLEPRERAA